MAAVFGFRGVHGKACYIVFLSDLSSFEPVLTHLRCDSKLGEASRLRASGLCRILSGSYVIHDLLFGRVLLEKVVGGIVVDLG